MIRRFKTMGKFLFLALICVIIVTPTSLSGGGGAVTGQLWLEPIGSTYNPDHTDNWGDESWIITDNSFNLTITNHNQKKCISIIYLLIAVNADPNDQMNSIGLTVNGISVNNWIPANGTKPEIPTADYFLYPTHGIYQTGAWYSITRIDLGTNLCSNESIEIPIVTSGGNGSIKFHGDGVGADDDNKAIVFVPPSHDFNNEIPEFPTIALPIAAIVGIMFILQSRKGKED
ncbi:MAG: PEF-CTERM sorting domain-containing protein [ANME-2 cluster archaeon]|nr:PEF-CTERM sorting domain-containing protein [ANME-2 cluster archaeon]